MMRNKVYPFYFAGGALVLYLFFFVLPSLLGFFYAFTDWSSYSSAVNFGYCPSTDLMDYL